VSEGATVAVAAAAEPELRGLVSNERGGAHVQRQARRCAGRLQAPARQHPCLDRPTRQHPRLASAAYGLPARPILVSLACLLPRLCYRRGTGCCCRVRRWGGRQPPAAGQPGTGVPAFFGVHLTSVVCRECYALHMLRVLVGGVNFSMWQRNGRQAATAGVHTRTPPAHTACPPLAAASPVVTCPVHPFQLRVHARHPVRGG
jgi:hypothetical protein